MASAPTSRRDLASLPGNVDIINHIRDLESIEDVHAYCDRLLASRFEDQGGSPASDDFEAYKRRVAESAPPVKFIEFPG